MSNHGRLALGSVQFGLPYGIANKTGQISQGEARSILEYAWQEGLNTLDTAIAYGDSEERLGNIGIEQWTVISKLPKVPEDCKDISGWIYNQVVESTKRLKLEKLSGLLLHHPNQLMESGGDEIYTILTRLLEQNIVEKIGISIYDPIELDTVLSRYEFGIVQAPFNIVDRRLYTSGWLEKLAKSGIEIHVRSIFLQGLLLLDKQKRRRMFSRWTPLWKDYDNWLNEKKISPLQACISFVNSFPEINRIVLGVDSLKQFQGIIKGHTAVVYDYPNSISCEDLDLIIPSKWGHS